MGFVDIHTYSISEKVLRLLIIIFSNKYKVQATKSGPNTYFLQMNGSFKEIEVHRLSDEGELTSTRPVIIPTNG